MTRSKTPTQEKEFMQFLRKENIPFKAQKNWLGHGEKEWITDFYLPPYETIVECKDFSHTNITNKYFMPRIERLYKDIYKLDELGELYNLQKILYVKLERHVFPLSFIANITTHKIFLMTDETHIHPILQGIEIFTNNKERYLEEKLKLKRLDFDVSQGKILKKITHFNTDQLELLWKYAHGTGCKELGLHPQSLARLLRRYVKTELNKEEVED